MGQRLYVDPDHYGNALPAAAEGFINPTNKGIVWDQGKATEQIWTPAGTVTTGLANVILSTRHTGVGPPRSYTIDMSEVGPEGVGSTVDCSLDTVTSTSCDLVDSAGTILGQFALTGSADDITFTSSMHTLSGQAINSTSAGSYMTFAFPTNFKPLQPGSLNGV